MSDDPRTENLFTEDGRRAQKIVKEEVSAQSEDGGSVRVTELWVEPKIEKKISQKVREHVKPFVHTREIETYNDETGEVETRVESCLDKFERLPLVERSIEPSVKSMSVDPAPAIDTSNLATKDDLNAVIGSLNDIVSKLQTPKVEAPSIKDQIAQRVEGANSSLFNLPISILYLAIAAEVVYFLYSNGYFNK